MVESLILVVVSVQEGRNFPRRPRCKLRIEAKFDGELLATDETDHIDTPEFATELAWELEKRTLHQHRLQRSPIKLQIIAVNSKGGSEAVGYVLLDLRRADYKVVYSQWYPLLSSQYHSSKPEVRIGISLETEGQQPPSSKKQPSSGKSNHSVSMKPATKLTAVLNENEGYYQIGPKDGYSEMFVLSIVIQDARFLTTLLPTDKSLPIQNNGFHFAYSILGVDVSNETFNDLLQPSFPVERASLRIRCSPRLLQQYFLNQPMLPVRLCCEDMLLGSGVVPLRDLITDLKLLETRPVTVANWFPLSSSRGNSAQFEATVILRRESIPLDNIQIQRPLSPKAKNIFTQTSQTKTTELKTNEKPSTGNEKKVMHTGVDAELDTNIGVSSIVDETRHKTQLVPIEEDVSYTATPQPSVTDLNSNINDHRHFCFSIDLKLLRNLMLDSPLKCSLRYKYSLVSTHEPISTSPVVIRPNMEVLVPHSFCAFDFACERRILQNAFRDMPLFVELWKHTDNDTDLIGMARIPLNRLLTCESIALPRGGLRSTYSDWMPIVSSHGNQGKILELFVSVSFDDIGSIDAEKLNKNTKRKHVAFNEEASKEEVVDPRQTSEYKAALELQMWKEKQQADFEEQLRKKEALRLAELVEEFKKCDRNRETILKSKIEDHSVLEIKLQKMLIELEKREKNLAKSEHEVKLLKSDLQVEHDRKMTELRDAASRMEKDVLHKQKLDSERIKIIEEENRRLRDQLNACEKRFRDREAEINSLYDQMRLRPEVKLQSEVSMLTLEKVELERKLDSVSKSKSHYKQQWGRALKELAKLKQREQQETEIRMKKQQQELDHMRLRYLAAEEIDVVKSEKNELNELKSEISKLKESSNSTNEPDKEFSQKDIENRIARLIEERDTLLRTGVYTSQDKIIMELDEHIRETISSKQS